MANTRANGKNGLALAIGATNRIGFWLWYAVPLGALLTGKPLLGALVYGAYGVTRGGAVLPMLLPLWSRFPDNEVGNWLISKYDGVRSLTAAALVVLGVAVLLLVGI